MLFLERQSSSSTIGAPRIEFNTKRSQSINLKTPFTLKSNVGGGTTDENKRSGSAHHRTTKSSLVAKDALCNLNDHVSDSLAFDPLAFSMDVPSSKHERRMIYASENTCELIVSRLNCYHDEEIRTGVVLSARHRALREQDAFPIIIRTVTNALLSIASLMVSFAQFSCRHFG
jgi:hypothetical protein